jgi:hypothetical protein
MIVALAGRRIDAPDAREPRFPLQNIELVRQRIRGFFAQHRPTALVCSAANGADLLALELAGQLAIERQIILPFPAEVFRNTSVIDRPGDWGELFDRVLRNLRQQERVTTLDSAPARGAYAAANQAILERAQSLASKLQETLMTVIVWNGSSRGERDQTVEFKEAAEAARIAVAEIPTL